MTTSLAAILLMAVQAAPVHADILDFSLNNSNSITQANNGDWTLGYLATSACSQLTQSPPASR